MLLSRKIRSFCVKKLADAHAVRNPVLLIILNSLSSKILSHQNARLGQRADFCLSSDFFHASAQRQQTKNARWNGQMEKFVREVARLINPIFAQRRDSSSFWTLCLKRSGLCDVINCLHFSFFFNYCPNEINNAKFLWNLIVVWKKIDVKKVLVDTFLGNKIFTFVFCVSLWSKFYCLFVDRRICLLKDLKMKVFFYSNVWMDTKKMGFTIFDSELK